MKERFQPRYRRIDFPPQPGTQAFTSFLYTDTTNDALINSMFGKLELLGLNFLSYVVDQRHAQFRSSAIQFIVFALSWLTPCFAARGMKIVYIKRVSVVAQRLARTPNSQCYAGLVARASQATAFLAVAVACCGVSYCWPAVYLRGETRFISA